GHNSPLARRGDGSGRCGGHRCPRRLVDPAGWGHPPASEHAQATAERPHHLLGRVRRSGWSMLIWAFVSQSQSAFVRAAVVQLLVVSVGGILTDHWYARRAQALAEREGLRRG